MKVSVGGWNERAPRDPHAAHWGVEADAEYITIEGLETVIENEISFSVCLSLSYSLS